MRNCGLHGDRQACDKHAERIDVDDRVLDVDEVAVEFVLLGDGDEILDTSVRRIARFEQLFAVGFALRPFGDECAETQRIVAMADVNVAGRWNRDQLVREIDIMRHVAIRVEARVREFVSRTVQQRIVVEVVAFEVVTHNHLWLISGCSRCRKLNDVVEQPSFAFGFKRFPIQQLVDRDEWFAVKIYYAHSWSP